MNVYELAAQLNELVAKGHGASEVRLRASYGDRVQVRTGVHGIQHELRYKESVDFNVPGQQVTETILLWGAEA